MRRPNDSPARIDWQAKADDAEARKGIHSLLATLFGKEPTAALLAALKQEPLAGVLASMGARLAGDSGGRSDEDAAVGLAVEYARLFLGPGPHVSLHESVHAASPGQRQLWGESAVTIKRLVEFLGLTFESDYGGIPDHLSVELELMGKLTEREAHAWRDQDVEGALWCLRHEQLLLRDHLARWVPALCHEIEAQAPHPFYRQASELLREFVALDTDMVSDSLGVVEGSRADADESQATPSEPS